MHAQGSNVDSLAAGGVVATRIFEAPRGLVFEAWTKVEHFTRWFGPHGAEVFGCELDPRPGGVIRFGHRLGGMTVRVKGTFREIVPDERIVFTIGFVDELGRPCRHPMFDDWPLETVILTSVVLESVGSGTRVTVAQHELPPAAASHPAVKRCRELALEGWKQVIARLGEHLSTHPDTKGEHA